MGTPGSGRKRTPVKDRFSAEDEALSNIAREVCYFQIVLNSEVGMKAISLSRKKLNLLSCALKSVISQKYDD